MFLKSPGEKVDVFLVQYGSVQKKLDGEKHDQALSSSLSKARKRGVIPASPISHKRARHLMEASQDDTPLPYHPNDPDSPASATQDKSSAADNTDAPSYYGSWEKYTSFPVPDTSTSSPARSTARRFPLSGREQRDEHNGDTDGTSHTTEADVCDGFGSPPRNNRAGRRAVHATTSPRFQRELEPSSSSSVVSRSDHSQSNSNSVPSSPAEGRDERVAVSSEKEGHHAAPSPRVINSPSRCDSSGGGSFDFMDPSFDNALLDAGAFFGAALSPNPDEFLNFHSTD